jgi:hypothetical protein
MERRQCVGAVRVAGSAGGEKGLVFGCWKNVDEEEKRSWFGFKLQREGGGRFCLGVAALVCLCQKRGGAAASERERPGGSQKNPQNPGGAASLG